MHSICSSNRKMVEEVETFAETVSMLALVIDMEIAKTNTSFVKV